MKTGSGGILGAAAACVLLLLGGCTTTARAEEESGPATIASRAVRLSYLEGDVRVALDGGSVWAEPRLNLTLTGGDAVRTAREARTELDWGGGALRVAGDSEVELDRVTPGLVRAWLEHGVVVLSVRALDEDETVAVSTRAGTVRAVRTGDYRIEDDVGDGNVLVIVRSGLVELDADGRYYRIHPGEMLRMQAGDPGSLRVTAAFAADGFDRWCAEREERIQRSVAARYVPAEVIGYEDLDAYGSWDYAPDYGNVWFPSVSDPGWTPYAFGSWIWVGSWGWTWVDSSPWGYAPYHYGRWVRYHDRWGWVPGPRHQRPPYRPAPEGWRHERPLQTGDGRVYRPPAPPSSPPPHAVPPRSPRPPGAIRPREDTRVTIPERPLRPTPQPPPRRRELPVAPAPAPATVPPVVLPPGERLRDGRPESGELRREREREPAAESRLQTREQIPFRPVAAPGPSQAPAAIPERPPAPALPAVPARPWIPERPAAPPRPAAPVPAPVAAPEQPSQSAPPQAAPAPAPAPPPRPAPRRQEPRTLPE